MFPPDNSDFDFGFFPDMPNEYRARCRKCGWLVMPDELTEHRYYSCDDHDPDPGFPLPPKPVNPEIVN